jgi:hypothetical protein
MLRKQIIECLSPKDSPWNPGALGELVEQLEFLMIDVDHLRLAIRFAHISYNKLIV